MQREDILELRQMMQQFIRSFGLLEPTRTPCGYALSLSQVFALQELERQTLSVTELADKLKLERSSVSRLIDGLVKEGFVARELNAANRREVVLSLTDKGRSSIGKVRDRSVEFYSRILGNMTEADQIKFVQSFGEFIRSLNQAKEDAHEPPMPG